MVTPYHQNNIKNTQRALIFFVTWSVVLLTKIEAQPIPNEFFQFKSQKLLYDAGENWETLTLFGPVRFQHVNARQKLSADSLYIKAKAGLYSRNDGVALYGFGHFTYQKYFFGYLYPRIVNEVNTFQRYSGIPRDIARGGFSSGETDLSGIGFQNSWVTLQVGRGRESWGAGNAIQLALSEESPAYDYAMLGSDYGNFRVNYIHGFLESTPDGINRYITARGMEWTNRESLVVGVSETVVYSGLNRPLDIGYMNPISSHLEIELNNRLNILDRPSEPSSANGVWQISLDWLIKDRLRLSGNYLIDEFVIDPEIEIGKEHGKAFSLRAAYTPVRSTDHILMAFASFVHVGTPTFRHAVGTNNFVQRGKPLGWRQGSDGQKLKAGINYFNRKNIIASISAGFFQSGEESVTGRVFDPYADYQEGSFPSGEVTESTYLDALVQWWWKPYISIVAEGNWISYDGGNQDEVKFTLGIDAFWPLSFTL